MNSQLIELYRSIIEDVEAVYVFPDIEGSSKYNPYLKLFYNELLSKSEKGNTIRCTSPLPLFPLFIVKRIFAEKSIVHYHWLNFFNIRGFFVISWKLSLLLLYKFLGGHIVWTVHNKHLHSKKYLRINMFFRRLMAKIATKLHVHCKEAGTIMAPILQINEDKFFIVKHPMYPVVPMDFKKAREYLAKTLLPNINTTKPLFLMYGNIGEYKGIIDIIPLITSDIGQLIIAGENKKVERRYLRNIESVIQDKNNICLINGFLPEEDEKFLFSAADCILFNFKEILSSGSVMLALSYKKKIVIPNIGCLKGLSGPDIYKFNTQTELKERIHAIAVEISL